MILGGEKWCNVTSFGVRLGPTLFEQAADLYSKSRIVLGAEQYRYDPQKTCCRPFEALACKRLYICDWNQWSSRYFRHQEHLLFSSNPDTTLELIRYYLDHKSEARAIAERGQQEVYAQHTYLHRLEEFINQLNGLYKSGEIARLRQLYVAQVGMKVHQVKSVNHSINTHHQRRLF